MNGRRQACGQNGACGWSRRLWHCVAAAWCAIAVTAMLCQDVVAQTRSVSDPPLRLEELPSDPYQPRPAIPPIGIPAGKAIVDRDGYVSVQVNVDEFGNNIPGDAANEPTIAVDPNNPNRIVIGWRQFDTVESDFRQAGVAYSRDAGRTWTFPGPLTPGVFRSDPVIVATADGRFQYLSLATDRPDCRFHCDLFTSTDGGMTWGEPVFAFGGDKAWITVDTTGGGGRNNLYETWTQGLGCDAYTSFARSTDGGKTFGDESGGMPQWGTLTVDLNGTLYVAGIGGVRRSEDAAFSNAPPSFSPLVLVDLGGGIVYSSSSGPNPGGLLGQFWIRANRSTGPLAGDLYVLASVSSRSGGGTDVMFSRSEDGGDTWSPPVRVNDDAVGSGAWHWFGMMDVAPNGRIDAVWNDTRNTGGENLSELYYSYSMDGGHTWSKNVPVSPTFDTSLGYPQQAKIGDYYGLVSDSAGVNIAYAATFNGEEDVYYLRIGPRDCNGNGLPDDEDIATGRSHDCNGDGVPDECGVDCNHNGVPDACELIDGAQDCDGNHWLDVCQGDLDGDGVIDPCDDDIDGDGVPNETDACPRLPVHGPASPDGFPLFSTDGTCAVNLWDYWRLYNCMTGSQPDVPSPAACFDHFDVDGNGAIDLRDVAVFQVKFTGSS